MMHTLIANPPKITVVVPVYNTEPYLEKCLTSILENSFTEIEVLLINDASPNGYMCDDYLIRDSRVRVIHHPVNKGLSAVRNEGIRQASADYITFIDSDDWVTSNMFLDMYNLAQIHKADIVSCNALEHFNGKPRKSYTATTVTALKGREMLEQLLVSHPNASHIACAKLYKRSVFSGITYPEGRIHEDAATTYKLYHKANVVVYTNAPYYCYAIHGQGIANGGFRPSSMDKLVAVNEMLDYVGNYCPELLKHAHCFQIATALRLAADFTPNVIQQHGEAYAQVTDILFHPSATQNKLLSLRHKVLLYVFRHFKYAYYYIWRRRLNAVS